MGPRGIALSILGVVAFLSAEAGHHAARELLTKLTETLLARYQNEASPEWCWFEKELTYDNALLPLALFQSFSVTGERTSLRVAKESLEFLENLSFDLGYLNLVGNAGWHSKGGVKAKADEQATDAAAFVLAFRGAYLATGDRHHLKRMRESFAWFLGSNRIGASVYNFVTAGCKDGLGVDEANQNEGAESTIAFLVSLQRMLELAGEGLEYPDERPSRSTL
jgi:hypothetical protein